VRFAQEGARVVINYAGHPEGANQTLDTIQKGRRPEKKASSCQADVTNMDDIRKLIRRCAGRAWGGCDILVNNGRHGEERPTSGTVTEADYDKVLAVT